MNNAAPWLATAISERFAGKRDNRTAVNHHLRPIRTNHDADFAERSCKHRRRVSRRGADQLVFLLLLAILAGQFVGGREFLALLPVYEPFASG